MSLNNPDGGLSADTIGLEEKLSKIRSQINSKLDNQKQLAIILSAVEENIEEQNNEKSPVTYFISFLSLLEQSIKNDQVVDLGLATSATYFLDIFLPFTPTPLLKGKFSEILTKLAPCLSSSIGEAPFIKSTIGILESLLLVQDNQQWLSNNKISPNRALMGLLELSFDVRPKVRKRAQEAVRNLLMHPPVSPLPTHIASSLVGEVSLNKLKSLVKEAKSNKNSKNSKNSGDNNNQLIHCLQLISIITSTNSWPTSQIENLCDLLLEISKSSDQYLISSTFQAFEGLFKSMTNIIDIEKFNKVLDIIFDLKPSINDTYLSATWLAVLAKGLDSFSNLAPEVCLKKLNVIVPIVGEFLTSDSKDITISSSQCLIAIISQTIPDEYLLQPNGTTVTPEIYELVDDFITFLSEIIEKEFFTIRYQHSIKEVLEFLTAAVLKLRSRCNPDFLSILEVVGEWRTNESDNFPYNKEVEDLIGAYISTMGPRVVLSSLPLNLTGTNNGPGRAWLLPLLKDNVINTELNFFKTEILPIVDFFKQKIADSVKKDTMHTKIFQTIIDQIWSLIPQFCNMPVDLRTSFDDTFAAQLSDLMYADVQVRTPICNGLRALVETNLNYIDAEERDLLLQQEYPVEEAKKNIEYLATKASNVLSVLFNVFSSTLPDSRGFVLETIDVYLRIIPKNDLENTFNKVCGLLKQAMDDEASKDASKNKSAEPALSITMLDLIVAMAKYVPESSHNALFSIFSTTVALSDNALMQKRSYRIVSRLLDTEEGRASVVKFIKEIQKVLIDTTELTSNSARAPRLTMILFIIELLPQTDLHFIPSVLQEIIMCTKDVNERTRELSYQILIKMGYKMMEGGVIENSKVPGFGEDTPSSEASLTEYFTMVSAGLAAQSPHMISATITAVSCLVFEFKDKLPMDILLELSSTVELFLTHNSREIAKSAIGFVKVEVLSMPEDLVRQNLKELLGKLMRWSHEHKGHFKSKVKHILERLIRKFGVEEVEQAIPEEDRKLVANIKKARNRASKKKAQDATEGEEPTEASKSGSGKKFVSAYEEALYDSDVSDDEVDGDDQPNHRKKAGNQFILDTGDEPLNLLDRQSLAHISSSKPRNVTKKELMDKMAEFKTSSNGKIMFSENGDDDILAARGNGTDAYVDAIKQAPVRGQRNKLKFKKNHDNEEWSDDDEDTVKQKNKKPANKVAGRSKVSKPKQKFKARKKL